MKLNKNNKGFTLVEIIAVVIILGIISTAVIIGYSKYIKIAKDNYYKKQEDLVTQAGREYFNDNRGKLPQALGEETCVLLETLVYNKYINPVKDYDNNSCSQTNSNVCARKIDTSKYIYYSTLDCGTSFHTIEYKEPVMTLTPSTLTPSIDETVNVKMKVFYNSGEKEESNIASYKYEIYEKGKDDTPYYDSKWTDVKNPSKTLEVDITLDMDGTYYVVGTAFNEKGKKVTTKTSDITLRFTLDCNRDITFTPKNYKYEKWTKEKIETTIKATGGVTKYNLKLMEDGTNNLIETTPNLIPIYYNAELDRAGKYYYEVEAFDKNNNSCTKRSGKYYIDRTNPTCTVTSNPNTVTNTQVELTATCSDSESGCKQTETKTTISDEREPYVFTNITDKAGNQAICEGIPVLIDKTPPIITVTAARCSDMTNDNACKNSMIDATKQTKTTSKTNPNQTITLNEWSLNGFAGRYSIDEANLKSIKWEWNQAGTFDKLNELKSSTTYTNTYIEDPVNNNKLVATSPGQRKLKLTAEDMLGNKSSITIVVYISRKNILTYNNNGGSGCTTKEVEYHGTSVKWGTLCTPTKGTASFGGWNTKEDGTGTTVTSETSSTGNQTVYAKWNKGKLYVKLHTNGATKNSDGQAVSEIFRSYELDYDGKVEINWPADYSPPYGYKLVRDGYVPTGKYHVGSANSTKTIKQDLVKQETPVTTIAESLGVLEDLKKGDVTVHLYAGWARNSKITINKKGGSGGTTTFYDRYGIGFYSTESATSTISSITVPTQTGYYLEGIFSSENGGGTKIIDGTGKILVGNTYFSQDTTIYAYFKKNSVPTYTITYNANGGSGAPAAQSYQYATTGTIKLSGTIPVRTGYAFMGWALTSNATSAQYTSGQNWNKSNANNYTLYAVWKQDKLSPYTPYIYYGSNYSPTNVDLTIKIPSFSRYYNIYLNAKYDITFNPYQIRCSHIKGISTNNFTGNTKTQARTFWTQSTDLVYCHPDIPDMVLSGFTFGVTGLDYPSNSSNATSGIKSISSQGIWTTDTIINRVKNNPNNNKGRFNMKSGTTDMVVTKKAGTQNCSNDVWLSGVRERLLACIYQSEDRAGNKSNMLVYVAPALLHAKIDVGSQIFDPLSSQYASGGDIHIINAIKNFINNATSSN